MKKIDHFVYILYCFVLNECYFFNVMDEVSLKNFGAFAFSSYLCRAINKRKEA